MGFSWNRCHTTLTTACRPRSPQPHSAPQDAESLLLPTGKGPLNWGGAMGISPTSNPRPARPDRVQRPGPLLQVTTTVRDNARRAAVMARCPYAQIAFGRRSELVILRPPRLVQGCSELGGHGCVEGGAAERQRGRGTATRPAHRRRPVRLCRRVVVSRRRLRQPRQ